MTNYWRDIMENKLYMSIRGEIKTYEEWKKWAITFYNGLEDREYVDLPYNWFQRVQRVLKLEEVTWR